MKRLVWLTLPLVFAATACDKKEEKAKSEKAPSAKKLSDKEVDQAEVPVKEEFEMKARSAINETNVEKQLDTLEKEINQDTK